MASKLTIIFMCTLLAFCESRFVDTIKRCDKDDDSCLKSIIGSLQAQGANGIKEYDIDPFDPIEVKDVKIPIFGLMNLTLEDVIVTGVKDCNMDKVTTDFDVGSLKIKTTCDLIMKANIKLAELSPLVKDILKTKSSGGGGFATITLKEVELTLEYYFDLIKKGNDIYVKCKPEEFRYKYKVGDAKVAAEKIVLGNEDVSEKVNEFLNQNWEYVVKTFGNNFFDIAIDILNDIVNKFFDKTPVNELISSDLTPYVKNV